VKKIRVEPFKLESRCPCCGSVKLIVEGIRDSRDFMRACLDVAKGGMNIVQMRQRLRVHTALDAPPDGAESVWLEDQDWKTLKQCVDEMTWALSAPEIIAFADAVEQAETLNPRAEGKPA